jgi:hypothetical protein
MFDFSSPREEVQEHRMLDHLLGGTVLIRSRIAQGLMRDLPFTIERRKYSLCIGAAS